MLLTNLNGLSCDLTVQSCHAIWLSMMLPLHSAYKYHLIRPPITWSNVKLQCLLITLDRTTWNFIGLYHSESSNFETCSLETVNWDKNFSGLVIKFHLLIVCKFLQDSITLLIRYFLNLKFAGQRLSFSLQ